MVLPLLPTSQFINGLFKVCRNDATETIGYDSVISAPWSGGCHLKGELRLPIIRLTDCGLNMRYDRAGCNTRNRAACPCVFFQMVSVRSVKLMVGSVCPLV
jgi:hypothetical protein